MSSNLFSSMMLYMNANLSHLSNAELSDLKYILDELEYKGDRHHTMDIMHLMHGSGFLGDIISRVKGWLSPCLCFGRRTTKTLRKYGDYPIVQMTLMRTPLDKMLLLAMEGMSLGVFQNTMRTYGFDEFFHLALVVTIKIEGGYDRKIIIEKEDIINVNDGYKTSRNTQTYSLPMDVGRRRLTINKLLSATRDAVGAERFYLYDPFKNNCQNFIRNILASVGLLSKEADEFIYQNIEEFAKSLPKLSRATAKTITDFSGTFSKLIGKGEIKKVLVDVHEIK